MTRRWRSSLGLGVALLLGWSLAVLPAGAQPGLFVLRVASLSQWSVEQQRRALPELAAAVERGVVDRPVFQWQRGLIARESLAPKPYTVLAGPEAEALGGRGSFGLAALRPSRGPAAWVELDVTASGLKPDDVLVLQIGGELYTMRQVLESVFVRRADGGLTAVPLSPRALVLPGPGIPVWRAPFGRPAPAAAATAFHRGPEGLELLVIRSEVETTTNGALTASGPADAAPHAGSGIGDWREGDRLYVRLTAARLQAGVPGLVLGWKDRTLRPDPDAEFPRASLAR
jgi:hypothetical protein